jgi:hypothetical protein
VRRGFAATSAVERICAGLDRLPLAIELAAARTRTLSPEEILAGVPAGTLRAALDWSHGLLDARGRELSPRWRSSPAASPPRPRMRSAQRAARRCPSSSTRAW